MIKKEQTIFNYYWEEKDKTKFKIWLLTKGISLNEVADRCNVTASYISQVMNGKKPFLNSLKTKLKELGFKI